MKSIFLITSLLVATAGFSQQNTDSLKKANDNRPGPSAIGTVVHLDNKNCPTAIRVVHPERKDTMYYLPIGYDMDSLMGKKITFRFGRLMIRQPLGCTGMVVRVWNVKIVSTVHKKKHKIQQ